LFGPFIVVLYTRSSWQVQSEWSLKSECSVCRLHV